MFDSPPAATGSEASAVTSAVSRSRPVDAFGLGLTTDDRAAVLYRQGVSQLLSGHPGAHTSFERSLEVDPDFALAHVGVSAAIGLRKTGDPLPALARAAGAVRGATRRERQHVEVVAAALGDDVPRAVVLAREHLAEFPLDALVLHVLTAVASTGGAVKGELADLVSPPRTRGAKRTKASRR